MNRRGFLGALLSTPVAATAAVVASKPKVFKHVTSLKVSGTDHVNRAVTNHIRVTHDGHNFVLQTDERHRYAIALARSMTEYYDRQFVRLLCPS